ncbi:hypothetical protein Bbelb_072870 [Branchiostoma belcheri]|nr:hypothetical protein Bbelb_072870 [Branchiostoma belcheri]
MSRERETSSSLPQAAGSCLYERRSDPRLGKPCSPPPLGPGHLSVPRATCYSCRAVTGDLMQASAGGALPRQMSHWQVSQTQSANLPTHVHRLVSTRLTTRVQNSENLTKQG